MSDIVEQFQREHARLVTESELERAMVFANTSLTTDECLEDASPDFIHGFERALRLWSEAYEQLLLSKTMLWIRLAKLSNLAGLGDVTVNFE